LSRAKGFFWERFVELSKWKSTMKSKSLILILMSLFASSNLPAQNPNFLKNANENAPVYCTRKILISQAPKKVWEVLTQIDGWPNWQNEINHSTLQGGLKPGSSFVWKTGGATIHSILHTVEPYSAFGWTGKTHGIQAIHNWNLREINGQTEVSVEESMQGFWAGLLKKSFNKNLSRGMEAWLQKLKAECERN